MTWPEDKKLDQGAANKLYAVVTLIVLLVLHVISLFYSLLRKTFIMPLSP